MSRRPSAPRAAAPFPPTARRALGTLLLLSAAACNDSSGPSTGSISLGVDGLPSGVNPSVLLVGPIVSGSTQSPPSKLLLAAGPVPDLAPGNYNLIAQSVVTGSARYAGTPELQTITIRKSNTPQPLNVAYALASGGLTVNIEGSPGAALAAVQVTGPAGFNRLASATTTYELLDPGSYTLNAQDALYNGHRFEPEARTQQVNVAASLTPSAATVRYRQTTGDLQVNVTGLPCGANAAITVSGPDNVPIAITQSRLLIGIPQGSYTVAASAVTASGKTLTPQPAQQTLAVTPGQLATTSVTYDAGTAPGLNYAIGGAYVVQVVQRPDGSVPLINGRRALLRVFVVASQPSAAAPVVRARFYDGANLVRTDLIQPTRATVPECTDDAESALANTWNAPLGPAIVKPGLRILVDVDPNGAFAESNESDNVWPAGGQPAAIDVRDTPVMRVRFVPVTQTANGLTGAVGDDNKDTFIALARKLFPIAQIDVDVRAPYATGLPVLTSNDGNGAWLGLLNEMRALQLAEGGSAYYFGLAKVSYTSGIAGYGFVPGRAAIGWDYLPSGSLITAHELGHNLSRFHAPCGGAGGPDPAYPYAGGAIGVYGWDGEFDILRPPTVSDVMGYCGFQWISDYNYLAILNHRTSLGGADAMAAAHPAQPVLVVWGRLDHGRLVLEPSFSSTAPPSLPSGRGRFRLEGLAADGRVLFSHAFDGEQVADAPDASARQFAFALPIDDATRASLATLRLSEGGRAVVRRALARAEALDDGALQVRRGTGRALSARLSWPASAPLAVVRDARSGEIIALARDGEVELAGRLGSEVEVTLSDGVRSGRARRLRLQAAP